MNANAGIKVDKATFYRFIERQAEGRFEYVRGHIVQHMTGGTLDHSRLIKRLETALDRQLDSLEWEVISRSRGVETAETVRYPGVVVELAGAERKGLATTTPTLVVEVMSPSSEDLDLAVKPSEYLSLPSLLVHVVASQGEPSFRVWVRDADGAFPEAPVVVEDIDSIVTIEALGVDIALSEIYRRMI